MASDFDEALLDEAAAAAQKSVPKLVAEIAYYRALSRWSTHRLAEAEEIVDAALPAATDVARSRLLQLLGSIDIRREKKLNIVVQFSLHRDVNMPDVPTVLELSEDPEVRQIFSNLVSNDEVGRSLFTTPNVPPTRLTLLRGAFQKMLADPEFRAEAERLNLPLATRTGEEMQQLVRDTLDVPATTLAKLRELVK